jgi:hypothetical protein
MDIKILYFFLFYILCYSCHKENDELDCSISGFKSLNKTLHYINIDKSNVNIVVTDSSNTSSSINYKKISSDTIIQLFRASVFFKYVHDKDKNKIYCYNNFSNNHMLYSYIINNNQIVTRISESNDSIYYIYDSSSIKEIRKVSSIRNIETIKYIRYYDYEFYDFSDDLVVLSYMFDLKLKPFIPKTVEYNNKNYKKEINYKLILKGKRLSSISSHDDSLNYFYNCK